MAIQTIRAERVSEQALTLAALGASFPSPDLAGVAAASFPSVPPVLREGPSFAVKVGPGLLQLSARDLARAERTHNRHADAPVIAPSDRPSRTEVTEWSRKSRANMVRAMSGADWSRLFSAGLPVMLTLTYPGDWLPLAPTGTDAKRHLDNFRRSWLDRWGVPLSGAWKLEFQRRGAPHFHLLVAAPTSGRELREWASLTWAGIVDRDATRRGIDQGDEQRARHLAAGTGVDVATGARMRDPRRVAVYFLKHGLKTADSKEYQHFVPEPWQSPGKGPGRFWGLYGVRVATADTYISVKDFVSVRRLLRRWAKANHRNLFQRGRLQGGWVSVNDGPAFAFQLSRALACS